MRRLFFLFFVHEKMFVKVERMFDWFFFFDVSHNSEKISLTTYLNMEIKNSFV